MRTGSLILLLAAAASAADTDHPGIPRMPGFELAHADNHDFGAFEFEVGNADESKTKRVEGRSWDLNYEIKEGTKAPSPLEIVRNYANAFKQKGGKVLFANEDSGQATLMRPSPGGGELWLHIDAGNQGEMYELQIVETAAMKQQIELLADAMASALKASGRVALHGILFDTGKAAIKPESQPLLDEIKKLLEADASLSLLIEGHTDDQGQKLANVTLSGKRADSVRRALLARGIDEARLTAKGLGASKPVADNKTEEGRAKNRRVELVKR